MCPRGSCFRSLKLLMEDTRGGGAVSAIFGKLLDSLSGKKHASPKENP